MIKAEVLAKQISDRIKQLLEEQNMTQKELSDKAYLSESCISRILSGNRMPSVKAIINISKAFNVKIIDIVQYVGIVK